MKSKITTSVHHKGLGHEYRFKTTNMSKKMALLFILISSYSFSQVVNNYQYVFVPDEFSVFKEKDKFHLNTNVKFLLQKYGFKSYFTSDSIPNEIRNSNCNKLYADLEKDNSIFNVKLKIVLKNCKDEIVYQTNFGSSKEKDLAIAYNQAFREAAKSFDILNYKYNGNFNVEIPAIQVKENDSSTKTIYNKPPLPPDPPIKNNPYPKGFYFAQPTITGFQIIDNEPKIIMRLFETSQKNVFIGEKGNTNGVVILKDQQWFFEYYENGKLVSDPLKLKF